MTVAARFCGAQHLAYTPAPLATARMPGRIPSKGARPWACWRKWKPPTSRPAARSSGDKERQQKFRGEVINVRGSGLRLTFTLRKISEGVGVERTFPMHGPSVADVKVIKHSKVRRAKLFYLR